MAGVEACPLRVAQAGCPTRPGFFYAHFATSGHQALQAVGDRTLQHHCQMPYFPMLPSCRSLTEMFRV